MNVREPAILDAQRPETVTRAAGCLQDGGLVIIPTDTVYGVAAAIDRPEAVTRLYHVKGRPLDRPIPVLVSEFDQVERLSGLDDPRLERLLAAFWPGALTIVVPAAPWIPVEIVRETGQVGLRMPDHSFARSLIAAAGGALATTSANRSGYPEARDAEHAASEIGAAVDLIVDGGLTPGGVPSTVVRLTPTGIDVLRRGAIDPARVAALLT